MVNMTLAIPEELHRRMKSRTDIKWSDVARQAFEARLAKQELIDKLLAEDKEVAKDADRIGHEIKKAVRQRLDARNSGHELHHLGALEKRRGA
jgi:hypothetical protein